MRVRPGLGLAERPPVEPEPARGLVTGGEVLTRAAAAVIRAALARRTSLRRRIADLARDLYTLDLARLNVAMAWLGYQWFWSGEDHDRAQAMIDDTLRHVRALVEDAAPAKLTPARVETLSLRVMTGYVIGLRRLRYGRATLDEAVAIVVEHTLD